MQLEAISMQSEAIRVRAKAPDEGGHRHAIGEAFSEGESSRSRLMRADGNQMAIRWQSEGNQMKIRWQSDCN
jgi:hypothetical protein